MVMSYRRVTRSSRPVANELGFFLALDFDFDVRGLDWSSDFDEDLAVDNIAWLVEGEFSLQLDLSRRENAAWVSEIIHYKKDLFLFF